MILLANVPQNVMENKDAFPSLTDDVDSSRRFRSLSPGVPRHAGIGTAVPLLRNCLHRQRSVGKHLNIGPADYRDVVCGE